VKLLDVLIVIMFFAVLFKHRSQLQALLYTLLWVIRILPYVQRMLWILYVQRMLWILEIIQSFAHVWGGFHPSWDLRTQHGREAFLDFVRPVMDSLSWLGTIHCGIHMRHFVELMLLGSLPNEQIRNQPRSKSELPRGKYLNMVERKNTGEVVLMTSTGSRCRNNFDELVMIFRRLYYTVLLAEEGLTPRILRLEFFKQQAMVYYGLYGGISQRKRYVVVKTTMVMQDGGVPLLDFSLEEVSRLNRLWMACQLVHAMIKIHEHDIFHGDVANRNVLVDHDFKLWLIDFGNSVDKNMHGTPQQEHEYATEAFDVYFLGHVLVHILDMHSIPIDVKDMLGQLQVIDGARPSLEEVRNALVCCMVCHIMHTILSSPP